MALLSDQYQRPARDLKKRVRGQASRRFFVAGGLGAALLALAIYAGMERRALGEDIPAAKDPAVATTQTTRPSRMHTTPMPTTRMDTPRVKTSAPPERTQTSRMQTTPMQTTTFPTTRPVPPKIEPMNTSRMQTTRPGEPG